MADYEDGRVNFYHIVIVDPGTGFVVVEEDARGWSLPFCHGRAIERGSLHVARYLSRLNLPGSLVYMVPARDRRGDCQAWHCVVRASEPTELETRYLSRDPERLDPGRSLIPGQIAALERYLAWQKQPPRGGPFVNLCWLDDVRQWIDARLLPESTLGASVVTLYRATPAEVVAVFETHGGAVCFKGRTPGLRQEAALTSLLAKHFPEHFAQPLAYDERRGWWLTQRIRGRCLSMTPTLAEAMQVIETMARIQRDAVELSDKIRALGVATLDAQGCQRFVERLVQYFERASLRREIESSWSRARLDRTIAALRWLCSSLASHEIPTSWVHTDLAFGNVIVNEAGAISFIDLEGSCLGIPCVAAQQFLENFNVSFESEQSRCELIANRLAEVWGAAWPAAQLRAAFRLMPAASSLYRLMKASDPNSAWMLDRWTDQAPHPRDIESLVTQVESIRG